jgi:SAM-dependent methyltransferase
MVGHGHPQESEWRVRRDSYETLRRRAVASGITARSRAADLGSGNGWLSHRLTALGCEVVAVDRLDDTADGLGACRHYAAPVVCAQADFDALPLASASIDLVVLNGSLHYSPDPAATLAEARRVLAPSGLLAVMDSPMFGDPEDGEAMVGAQLDRFHRDYGLEKVVRPGVGFLTFDGLRQATAALGLRGRFFPSRGTWRWRLRRQVSRLRLKRAPAAFGVWVAQ